MIWIGWTPSASIAMLYTGLRSTKQKYLCVGRASYGFDLVVFAELTLQGAEDECAWNTVAGFSVVKAFFAGKRASWGRFYVLLAVNQHRLQRIS
jgi:Zn-dependent M28 family amino/carboxypeptidase